MKNNTSKISTFQKFSKHSMVAFFLISAIGDSSYAIRIRIDGFEVGSGKVKVTGRIYNKHKSDHHKEQSVSVTPSISVTPSVVAIPEDFNPELYLNLNPGIRAEALRLNREPLAYAKLWYVTNGYKTPEVRYLPEEFNPELYLILNPGVRAEAERLNREPLAYAKLWYATNWRISPHYLPEDFNPQRYLELNPGIGGEALRLKREPLAYAKLWYATNGYKTPEVRYK